MKLYLGRYTRWLFLPIGLIGTILIVLFGILLAVVLVVRAIIIQAEGQYRLLRESFRSPLFFSV